MDLNILIGVVGLLLTLAGLIYSRNTFQKEYVDKPNEEKQNLIIQFKATQSLSKKLYVDLLAVVERNNAFEQEAWPSITYRQYLEELENSHKTNLSDECLDAFKSDIPSGTIQSMTRSLEQQFDALNLMYTDVKVRYKDF